jgi:hypothetical protein
MDVLLVVGFNAEIMQEHLSHDIIKAENLGHQTDSKGRASRVGNPALGYRPKDKGRSFPYL